MELDVAEEVAALLGSGVDRMHQTLLVGPVCTFCGRQERPDAAVTMALVAVVYESASGGDPGYQMVVAHPGCHPSAVSTTSS